jgi:GNAT superfamily N-acetyltransferase
LILTLDFDRRFFRRPCYRLSPAVSKLEWHEFDELVRQQALFADLKIAASDLDTADEAFKHSFRKICTQVELTHQLTRVEPVECVGFSDSLEMNDDQRWTHAEQFRSCRFRQDPLIPTQVAVDLYAAWIANSLSGGKRVAALGTSFCSFADTDQIRTIDLLSVIEKRRGHGTKLVRAVLHDAKSRHLREVRVTTEAENQASMNLYRVVGFDVMGYRSIFHVMN